jgi:DNA-directed RNA polymerase specialized sigma24 family protein
VSTSYGGVKRAAGGESSLAGSARELDMAEEIAAVACARRDLLLGVHRHRLRREDLEDCYSQASLELIAHARRGGAFAGRAHIANALELRLLSRIRDRRRALGGRSPLQAALEQAVPLADCDTRDGVDAGVQVTDARACVETQVLARDDLRAIGRALRELTADQRLVLTSQLADETCDACCSRLGWSREKYRKVAQRARAHLRRSIAARELAVPSALARSEQTAGPTYEQTSRS